jgi:starch phosphorylase
MQDDYLSHLLYLPRKKFKSRSMTDFKNFIVPYEVNKKYNKKVAYFSMEFAIDQALKIYSGGLGFLAGSHMRSAYELNQNMIGIGILWKFGYYDQSRNQDQTLNPTFYEKIYNFLEDTGIKFQIEINKAPVWVKALYLNPKTFGTAPVFLLSTDLPENDYLAQTISHRLYDSNTETKIAQFLLLGIGGARLIDELGYQPEFYHLNEAHAAPAIMYLFKKYGGNLEEVRKRLVFTTHTPEEAGNEVHDLFTCNKMGYFLDIPLEIVKRTWSIDNDLCNHSLIALRSAKLANAVSKLHSDVSRSMWYKYPKVCEIISITNAQNYKHWSDKHLYSAMMEDRDDDFASRKRYLKKRAFQNVSDQTGKLFDPDVLTIVWARRFAGYKRANLITRNLQAFTNILENKDRPVQIIFAGKPYPQDYSAIAEFNSLVHLSKRYKNMAVCIGYELGLSKRLKQAADIWLNNPRVPREASGTSGMTAAMCGAINFSTFDGWICEFSRHGENSFVIPQADYQNTNIHQQDEHDLSHLYRILNEEIIPTYYDRQMEWRKILYQGMKDVAQGFESGRMAREYYELLYQ